MKKDVAFAIVLMVAGALGLVFPPKFSAGAEPATAKPAHVLWNSPVAKVSVLNHASELRAVKCSRNASNAEAKDNLLHKVSVAFADLNTVISLQSM